MFLNGFLSNYVTKIWILKFRISMLSMAHLKCFKFIHLGINDQVPVLSFWRKIFLIICFVTFTQKKDPSQTLTVPTTVSAERPDVKVAFGLLPFYKRAILKKAKSRCLFFKKCILIFLKCEDISLFRTSRKKSTHNGGEKLQLIAQNSQRPSFEWFLRAKSGLNFFCECCSKNSLQSTTWV